MANAPLPILNCDNCGVCCMSLGHPWFDRHNPDPLWLALPQSLRDEINAHIAGLTDVDLGEPCIWLDLATKKCRHYEYRPQMCRDFEIGNPHCRRMRQKYGIESSNQLPMS